MKFFRIFFFPALILFGFCFAQAESMNSESDGYCGDDYKTSGFFAFKIDTFFAFDENNLLISCDGGLSSLGAATRILTSDNGGKTWAKRLELESSSIGKFIFPADKTGFAVGGLHSDKTTKGRILKTIDGGLTWKDIPIEISEYLEDIQFIDKQRGWITSDKGNFLKTNDGGNTWTIISQKPITKKELQSVNSSFSDDISGWTITFEREFINNSQDVINDGDIYQTLDGGNTWKSQKEKFIALLQQWKPTGIRFQAIKFFDAKTGYIAAHFEQIQLKPNDGNRYIIFEGGAIFSTKDGGKSWETNILTTDLGLKDASFLQSGKFWMIPVRVWQTEKIFSTKDYGKSWEQLSTKFTDGGTPSRIYFLNDKIGFLITDLGYSADDLYRTLDGGKTWELRRK